MRMRKRHNLSPRMEACGEYLIPEPQEHRPCQSQRQQPFHGLFHGSFLLRSVCICSLISGFCGRGAIGAGA